MCRLDLRCQRLGIDSQGPIDPLSLFILRSRHEEPIVERDRMEGDGIPGRISGHWHGRGVAVGGRVPASRVERDWRARHRARSRM